jgi:ferric-dicitrate binding protein FerR (iron transport regulator)
MDSKIETLFLAYLENTITPRDEKLLVSLIKKNPSLAKELYDYRTLWQTSELVSRYDEYYLSEEWLTLLEKVKSKEKATINSKGTFLHWLPRIAAVFLLGALLSFAVSYSIFNTKSRHLTYYEINTPQGAKSTVTLPDGSKVWLNAGSNLKYSNQFGLKERVLELSGEAYFNVATDPDMVFLVKTSELNVKAYGTAFNVKSYPEEGTIEATLIEGSIGVTRTTFANKTTDEVMLKPNQRVVYYKKTAEVKEFAADEKKVENEVNAEAKKEQKLTYLISKGIDPKEFTSWKDGTLFISSETLEALAVKLERKYDVKIHFENKNLKTLKFTGSLENETVEQVIEAISIAAKIDYEIDEREIWLKEQTK